MRVAPVAFPSTAGATTDTQSFSASGTWTKPLAIGTIALIQCWGGGGGAGSGSSTNSNAQGGAGGGGGGYSYTIVPISQLAATVSVTIAAGGTGGAAVAYPGLPSNYADGLPGTNGGQTSFGTLITADKGNAGARGQIAINTGGAGTGPWPSYTIETVYFSSAGGGGDCTKL